MPTFRFKGLDEYIIKLERLNMASEKMIGEAVYEGAKVVADATKQALKGIDPDDSRGKGERRSITTYQKNGLIDGFGVSHIQDKNGFINVKTGFQGYNLLKQPNVRVGRMLESGTSRMPKNPVIRKASFRARKEAERAMKESFEKNIQKMMK